MHRFITVCIVGLLGIVFLLPIHHLTASDTINIDQREVAYTLPYSGLLPDHPLYPFKRIRDWIQITTTRDLAKRAERSLVITNRMVSEARGLAEKGKDGAAYDHLYAAHERFLTTLTYLQEHKAQGGEYPERILLELELSNQKHKEIIGELMKQAAQTEIEDVQRLLRKNSEVQAALEALP